MAKDCRSVKPRRVPSGAGYKFRNAKMYVGTRSSESFSLLLLRFRVYLIVYKCQIYD